MLRFDAAGGNLEKLEQAKLKEENILERYDLQNKWGQSTVFASIIECSLTHIISL